MDAARSRSPQGGVEHRGVEHDRGALSAERRNNPAKRDYYVARRISTVINQWRLKMNPAQCRARGCHATTALRKAKRAPRAVIVLVFAGAIPMAANAQQSAVTTTSLVFDGATVVDVEQGKLLPAQRVVITGNRIQAVGD